MTQDAFNIFMLGAIFGGFFVWLMYEGRRLYWKLEKRNLEEVKEE